MKEFGELHLGSSETVPKGSFLLAIVDHAPDKGEGIPNNALNIIFASVDASLADRLMTLGIARKLNYEGVELILILNENEDVKF